MAILGEIILVVIFKILGSASLLELELEVLEVGFVSLSSFVVFSSSLSSSLFVLSIFWLSLPGVGEAVTAAYHAYEYVNKGEYVSPKEDKKYVKEEN